MSTPIQAAPVAPVPYWSGATRIAFRFCFVYFGLFCLLTQVLGSLIAYPDFEVPDLSSRWPIRPIVFWTARHVFGIAQPLVYKESGSGDKTYDWVLVFCLMLMAAGGVTVWTFLDRRSETYRRLYGWFRLFMRFTLASQMIVYGMDKAVPLQMPFPYLSTLVEPFGNLSPMGVLWSSIGASPAYEIFAGCAELLGGILLFFPRTVVLGGLVCLVDMIQVFMLNMTYDVPVKLFSFHLILISLIIVAPALRSLAGFSWAARFNCQASLPCSPAAGVIASHSPCRSASPPGS